MLIVPVLLRYVPLHSDTFLVGAVQVHQASLIPGEAIPSTCLPDVVKSDQGSSDICCHEEAERAWAQY